MGKAYKLNYDPVEELKKSFDRWENIFENGCSDPYYTDGVNLHIVRNHILHYREDIENMYPEGQRPEIYQRDVPPEIDMGYMARADEIREAARASLEQYRSNADYRYIISHADALHPKERERLNVRYILGYVSGLESKIRGDDLVGMRMHRDPYLYLQSFEKCASEIRAALENPCQGQMNLFSLICEQEDNDDYDESEGCDDHEEYDEEYEEAYDLQ